MTADAALPAEATVSRAAHAAAPIPAGRLWVLLVACTILLLTLVVLPVALLHPFRPQTAWSVALAYEMRRAAPLVTAAGLVVVAFLAFLLVRGGRRLRWRWAFLGLLAALAMASAWFARQNHFEWMFQPLPEVTFARAAKVDFVDESDMVLAVEIGGDAVAYPVRQLAYHHLAMDTVAREPVVATYCTLCHTGLVWKRTLDGRVLTFRLFGINNQNMVMRDDQTGSWWQQATGEAIQGPLRGKRLEGVLHDEISFAVFRRERPGGRVLRPASDFRASYAPADWERRMKKRNVRTVTPTTPGDPLPPRTHVVGVAIDGRAKAYPFPSIRTAGPVNDVVGGVPIVVVVGEDRKSVRVFERTLDGRRLEFFAKAGTRPRVLVDAETGSEWDFSGTATSGPLVGSTLGKVKALKEYWFDWKLHRPHTSLYSAPAS
jgi:hypothetical protein